MLRDDVPPISASNVWVPPPLEALVARLLQRDPAKRPASSDDVLIALILVRDHESSPLSRRIRRLRRRVSIRVLVVAAVGLALVAGVLLWLQ